MQRTHLVTTSAGCEREEWRGSTHVCPPNSISYQYTPSPLGHCERDICLCLTSAFLPFSYAWGFGPRGHARHKVSTKARPFLLAVTKESRTVRSRTELVSSQRCLLAPVWFYVTFPLCSLPVLEQTMRGHWSSVQGRAATALNCTTLW